MALAHWKSFFTDEGAVFDREVVLDAAAIAPLVTWGTSPEDVMPITGLVPDPASFATPDKQGDDCPFLRLTYASATDAEMRAGASRLAATLADLTQGKAEFRVLDD